MRRRVGERHDRDLGPGGPVARAGAARHAAVDRAARCPALSEIVVGTIAQLVIGAALGGSLLAGDASWLKFLAGAGAIVLTFLAGAELDPKVSRRKWKEASAVGLVGFVAPFLGCTALAR